MVYDKNNNRLVLALLCLMHTSLSILSMSSGDRILLGMSPDLVEGLRSYFSTTMPVRNQITRSTSTPTSLISCTSTPSSPLSLTFSSSLLSPKNKRTKRSHASSSEDSELDIQASSSGEYAVKASLNVALGELFPRIDAYHENDYLVKVLPAEYYDFHKNLQSKPFSNDRQKFSIIEKQFIRENCDDYPYQRYYTMEEWMSVFYTLLLTHDKNFLEFRNLSEKTVCKRAGEHCSYYYTVYAQSSDLYNTLVSTYNAMPNRKVLVESSTNKNSRGYFLSSN